MPLLTSLLILIVVARLFGQLLLKFKQPAIVGEMLAGVLLGPSVLGLIHATRELSAISDLAVFLIVLSAGLEMNFKDVTNALRGRGVVIAVLGFIVPLLSGIFVGRAFDMDVMKTVFLGLCISITALPVAVKILQSFDLLKSDIARYSVATAIFNDIAALLALGVILNLPTQRSFQALALSVFWTGGKLVILAGFILGFNRLVEQVIQSGIRIQRIPERLIEVFGNEALFGILILFVLVFGSVSEVLGFHFVIGAFFGALLIDRKFFFASRYHELERTLSSVTGGFLAPIFFAYLGLEFNLGTMKSASFIVVVLIVSIVSKILAGWIGGRLIGLSQTHAFGIGLILNGRGVMELVIASIAFSRGFIGQSLFSTLVLMGVVTTMATPIAFRKWVMPKLEITPS
jgi:Kef-type K+ transport system membrane component KefB